MDSNNQSEIHEKSTRNQLDIHQKKMKNKIITALLLIILCLISVSPVFAEDTKVTSGCTLAATPANCGTTTIECVDPIDPTKISKTPGTPRNCLFLEEPIGGKKGYDLYVETCIEKDKKWECKTVLWRGESIGSSTTTSKYRGPIQAIITEDKSKPYQGPFTLLYNYLGLVYKYMSGVIVGVAVLFVVIGGIQMTTSYGDQAKFDEGKTRIQKAIVGMILWFTASLILYTINPTFFAF